MEIEMNRWPRLARVGLGLLLASSVGLAACGGSGQDQAFGVKDPVETEEGGVEANYSFTIPEGTGESIDAGQAIDLIPAQMDVKVGEVIEIVNRDDRGFLVGPFFVGANETIRHEFAQPGTFVGECGVHSSGQITITVT